MTQWQPKAFSELTKVSVRTLHYYDEIGLLTPSARLPNGFRLYSEDDLLKLQQIVALKFFGFALSEIQALLAKKADPLKGFQVQKQSIENQIAQLQNAEITLGLLIQDLEKNGSIQWNNIVKSIEDYGMSKETEMIWGVDEETQKEHQQYLVDQGIATQAQIDECNNRVKNWNEDKVKQIAKEQDALFLALADVIKQNLNPDSDLVQYLIGKHFDLISHYWTPNKQTYVGLAKFYQNDPEFAKHFEVKYFGKRDPKIGKFLVDAMTKFAEINM